MPKVGVEDFRKKSLISATLHTIQDKGTIDIRVSDVARHAGVSSGLAHHYFGNKNQMILAALRFLLTEFRGQVNHALRSTTTPRGRLSAIIAASLNQCQFSQENITAWLIFYAHAQENIEAQKLLQVYVRRLRSNLLYDLKKLTGEQAGPIAEIVASLIDGFYIRQALRMGKADGDYARSLIEHSLDLHILAAVEGPGHDV
ncbi:transcriptional regulator BetI [Sneathiella sp.]|jgi:TetR/AcrR family transcriptional repressor of bet genes|uniref:transcriptional regulator BetI n=1 Tax=Sneathiella sp. TaxID=1964365 RepID=UPI0039E261E3